MMNFDIKNDAFKIKNDGFCFVNPHILTLFHHPTATLPLATCHYHLPLPLATTTCH
jgi:hypothetical protein